MVALGDLFHMESGLCRLQIECTEVDIDPVERIALYLLLLHLEINFPIIRIFRRTIYVALLILAEITQVA